MGRRLEANSPLAQSTSCHIGQLGQAIDRPSQYEASGAELRVVEAVPIESKSLLGLFRIWPLQRAMPHLAPMVVEDFRPVIVVESAPIVYEPVPSPRLGIGPSRCRSKMALWRRPPQVQH